MNWPNRFAFIGNIALFLISSIPTEEMKIVEALNAEDLISIVATGGGLDLDVGNRTSSELISIASAASQSGARIIFRGLNGRMISELINIASAGKGAVQFAD